MIALFLRSFDPHSRAKHNFYVLILCVVQWCWLINWGWGWLINWGWGWFVSWSWFVSWLVFWVFWLSGVCYFSNVTTISIRIRSVGNSLNATIREVYGVRSSQGLAVGSFGSVESGSGVVISYTILKSEWFWGFVISSWVGRCVVWGRMVCNRSSHKGEHNSESKHIR